MQYRVVKTWFDGRELWLNYSVSVLFDVADKYGTIQAAFEKLGADTTEAFEVLRWLVTATANDGELCRREQGLEKRPLLTEKDLSPRMAPMEFGRLRDAVIEAVRLGYSREAEDEEQEIDVGLAELTAKKAPAGK